MTPLKPHVARAFGAAASSYDAAARVQARAAALLADRIAALRLPPGARVLEVGCGTGFLTAALRDRIDAGLWVASDLAPEMADACRRKLAGDVAALAMDGERPAVAGGFDLICSSLAMQWFADAPAAIERWRGLLRPGGSLAVATLGEDSLRSWYDALAASGAPRPVPAYPALAAFADALAPWDSAIVDELWLEERHEDGLRFLRALRDIGAAAAADGAVVKPGILRRALRRIEADGAATVAYHVLFGIARKA